MKYLIYLKAHKGMNVMNPWKNPRAPADIKTQFGLFTFGKFVGESFSLGIFVDRVNTAVRK